ncbi:MAG: NAD-dependent epimerase/dehydratase family protein [Candidatus Woesearchaeota archaeon]
MEKVLVTGGAGYIGSIVCRLLRKEGCFVRVLDNLRYGGETLVHLLNDDNFDFIKGDVREINDLKNAVKGIDHVVHMAAIVGDPACKKEPELAQQTNFVSTKELYSIANSEGVKKFLFASTCSNYGKMEDPDRYVNEDSKLAPVSLYAETKVDSERYLLNQDKKNICKPTCLRFSTVYGLSPRIRFDLTVNEFTKEIALGRELIVFGEQFWRPYCHVQDLARSVLYVIENKEGITDFNVYNVGDTAENYQKQTIVEEIQKQIPEAKIKYVEKNEDPRDYKVSFEKIKNDLGFQITKKVPDGIAQIKKIIEDQFISDPDAQKYRNS